MTSPSTPQFFADSTAAGEELRLPRPPGVVRRFWGRHPRVADLLLALLWGLLALTGAARSGQSAADPWLDALTIVLIAISVAGFFVRRRHPLLTVLLTGGVIVAVLWAPGDMILAPAVFAVYSVPIHRSVRAGWVAAAAVEVASILALTCHELLVPPESGISPLDPADGTGASLPITVLVFAIQFGVVLALAVALGTNIGNRRRYTQALIDRARQLATERDQQARIATAAERARIAREMHDIVSHSLTLMIALAEGSAVAAASAAPDAAEAMRKAADTGRAAMVDMRRMLGVLGGGEEAETAPQPGLDDLPRLVDEFRSLGLPVAYRCDGRPRGDSTVQLAVHRVVQEALVNVLRYAHGPTEVAVTIRIGEQSIDVAVTDDGLGGFPADPAGAGRGLLGLRERITALGGEFTAGPAVTRGWSVSAVVPIDQSERDDRR